MIRSVPLADQLMQEIATEISKGKMVQYDGRLPSENELSQQYGVSRSTVREVLARLESAGVVVRRRGIGTFISEPLRSQPDMIWGWLDQAPAFIDLISQAGYEARDEVLNIELIPAAEVASHLDLQEDEPIVVFEKIFRADETPILYSWTAIARQLLHGVDDAALLSEDIYRHSVYEFLQKYCSHDVSYQTSEVHALKAGEMIAEYLQTETGAPLLHVAEIAYAREGLPVFYATHYFRGDRVSFRQIRIPTFTIEPA